jgi:hypothetical protein
MCLFAHGFCPRRSVRALPPSLYRSTAAYWGTRLTNIKQLGAVEFHSLPWSAPAAGDLMQEAAATYPAIETRSSAEHQRRSLVRLWLASCYNNRCNPDIFGAVVGGC